MSLGFHGQFSRVQFLMQTSLRRETYKDAITDKFRFVHESKLMLPMTAELVAVKLQAESEEKNICNVLPTLVFCFKVSPD